MYAQRTEKYNQRGFTIIELMIVAALLTIVMGVVVTIFLDTVRTANFQETDVRMRDEARRAFHRTIELVRTGDTSTMQIVDTAGVAQNFAPGVVGNGIIFRMPTDLNGDFTVNDGTGGVEYTGFFYIGLDPNDETRLGEWVPGTDRNNDAPTEVYSDVIVAANNDGDGRNAPNGGFVVTVLDGDSMQIDIIMERPRIAGNSRVITRESRAFNLMN